MAQNVEYNSDKKLNLETLVPEQTIHTDYMRLIKMYEDYLNNMYNDDNIGNNVSNYLVVEKVPYFDNIDTEMDIQNTTAKVERWKNKSINDYANDNIKNVSKNVTFDYIKSHIPSGAQLYVQKPKIAETINSNGISLLEKIYRIADVHDPWLTPFNLLQEHADFMGYDNNLSLVNLERDSDYETEQQSRFMIESLPHWYKIKTTEDSIKLLLFTFGLYGGLLNYYTKDYSTNRENWSSAKNYFNEKTGYNLTDLTDIPDDYFPTPHFAIWYDMGVVGGNTLNNDETRKTVVRAINAIKPVNKIFSGIISIYQADPAKIRIQTAQISKWRLKANSLLYGTTNTQGDTGFFDSIDNEYVTNTTSYSYAVSNSILT